jgi:outer membrane protein TolC
VANFYIVIRTVEKRLAIAQENVATQKESLKIAQARFEGGTTAHAHRGAGQRAHPAAPILVLCSVT